MLHIPVLACMLHSISSKGGGVGFGTTCTGWKRHKHQPQPEFGAVFPNLCSILLGGYLAGQAHLVCQPGVVPHMSLLESVVAVQDKPIFHVGARSGWGEYREEHTPNIS